MNKVPRTALNLRSVSLSMRPSGFSYSSSHPLLVPMEKDDDGIIVIVLLLVPLPLMSSGVDSITPSQWILGTDQADSLLLLHYLDLNRSALV